MRTARVHRVVRRIAEGICAIFILLLIIRPIYAAPTCPPKPGENKIGFCGPNMTYHEWGCISCPPGLGSSATCGKVYPKVIKIECQPCKDGTYSDENSFGQCKPCTTTRPCQKNEVQIGECKPNRNTLQCKCKKGYYKAFTGYCMPCSWCCRDKTNVYKAECQDLEKKCSYQDVQSCDPSTTYTPGLNSTTATPGLNSTTATPGLNSITATPGLNSTTATPGLNSTTATPGLNSTLATDTSNGSKSFTKSKEMKQTSGDTRREGDEKADQDELLVKILCPSLLIIALAVICTVIYFCRKKNGNSSDNDSSDPEVSGSSLASNEQSSLATLIKGKESTTSKNNEKIEYAKKEEDHPLLQPCGSGTDRDGPVMLDPDNVTAAYHIEHQGPNGEQTLPMANGTVPLTTTTLDLKDKLCFICEKLGQKVSDLKFGVKQRLCEMLNVPIDGKDYRNLDEFCSLDVYQRKRLEQSQNPMEGIIEILITRLVTLKSFLEELYRISRGDVVQELYNIAKEKK